MLPKVTMGQGINNNWFSGYDSEWSTPNFGISKLDFFSGLPVITQDSFAMEFRHTHANISDVSGNMLFYTNGYYIADATDDTMQNGNGINPGAYANFAPDGFLIAQGALIIPKPGSNTIYYLFHNSVDNYPSAFGSKSYNLKKSEIDMSLNAGLGAVVSKNQIVINDTINVGKITACRHANGRDWWVVVHRVNTNTYYKLLVFPNFILGPYAQNIGAIRTMDDGQAKFSPDGKTYAYYHYASGGLDILDFDRCTGMFSNPRNDASIPTVYGNVGCEFSPNSQLLYVSNVLNVYQYDLTATNVIASRTMVAAWDSFTQPGQPNLGAYLCNQQLAPDGKIYITTGNSTTYFGRIDDPDIVGVGCNVAQHSVLLPTYNFNTIPNHPNYFLGCDTTGGCTTCYTSLASPLPLEGEIKVAPNPTTGAFAFQFDAHSTSGEVEVHDMMGNLVLRDYVAPWSLYKYVNISALSNGIYFCKMKWKDGEVSVKVINE